tara:strand:- start:100 stop:600 length:501 start_codon:yes stop_codon:yes gene_type:complete
MNIIRILNIVLSAAIIAPAVASAHTLPGEDGEHAHDHGGSGLLGPYHADKHQPLYTQLAECAAIFASVANKGGEIENLMDASYHAKMSRHAPKLRDKAVSIARKQDHEAPEIIISDTYDRVYDIWQERWVFQEDDAHYALMAENQQWLVYCDKLGVAMNVFSAIPE